MSKRNDRTPTKAKRPSPTKKRGFAGIVSRTAGKKPAKATARKVAQARELARARIRRDAARRAAQARKAKAYRRSQAAKRGWQKRRELAHKKPTRFQVRVPFATFEQIRAGRKPPTPAQVAKAMRKALKMVAENMRKLYPTAVQDGYFALGLERAISRQIKGPVWEMEASPVWTGATHYMEALGDDKPELLASDNMGSAKPYRVAVLAVMADGFVRASEDPSEDLG